MAGFLRLCSLIYGRVWKVVESFNRAISTLAARSFAIMSPMQNACLRRVALVKLVRARLGSRRFVDRGNNAVRRDLFARIASIIGRFLLAHSIYPHPRFPGNGGLNRDRNARLLRGGGVHWEQFFRSIYGFLAKMYCSWKVGITVLCQQYKQLKS